MAKEFKLTQESYDKLKEELEYLKTVREKEVAEQIKEARSFGDLSENSEYDEAKNEQGKLYSRIAEVENVLANAIIMQENYAKDEVAHGSTVTIKDLEDGSVEKFTMVGSQETDPINGKISDESPLGKALLGARLGETIKVEAPAGQVQYEILEITR